MTVLTHIKHLLQPAISQWYRIRNIRRGSIYGLAQPAWWPDSLPWWLGPRNPHDGRQVEIRLNGESYVFLPAQYGRFKGHRYDGRLRPDAHDIATYLEQSDMPVDDADLLAAVSLLEGGFDTIQTYDRARFSWGFIQFAGTGSLVGLLQSIKTHAPESFQQYFHGHGIDVHGQRLVIASRKRVYKGGAALNLLHDEPRLWKRFLLASFDPLVQREQVRVAYDNYYLRILAQSVRLGKSTLTFKTLFEHHRYGRAMLLDRAIHKGLVYATRLFKRAAAVAQAESAGDAQHIVTAASELEPPEQQLRWNKLAEILNEKSGER